MRGPILGIICFGFACTELRAGEPLGNPSIISKLHLFAYDPNFRRNAERLPGNEAIAEGQVILLEPLYLNEARRKVSAPELMDSKAHASFARRYYLNPAYQRTIGPLAAIAGLLADPLAGWAPNTPEALVLYEQDNRIRRNREIKELQALDACAK